MSFELNYGPTASTRIKAFNVRLIANTTIGIIKFEMGTTIIDIYVYNAKSDQKWWWHNDALYTQTTRPQETHHCSMRRRHPIKHHHNSRTIVGSPERSSYIGLLGHMLSHRPSTRHQWCNYTIHYKLLLIRGLYWSRGNVSTDYKVCSVLDAYQITHPFSQSTTLHPNITSLSAVATGDNKTGAALIYKIKIRD